MKFDGSWHGGKGSRRRKPQVDSDNYRNVFKNSYTWLELRRLKESWL